MIKLKSFIKSVITLFKAVPSVQNISDAEFSNDENITKGFFITESAFKTCPIDEEILKFIEEKFGYDIFQLNQGFYKSFKTVTELTPQKILANKLLHYMSTYNFELLGIFSHDTVFIPNAELELPADATPVKLTIINSISDEEIINRVNKMIMSGIALSDETLDNLTTIINYLEIKFDVDSVPNKELRVRLCEFLNLLPKNPAEFLRYMIYKACDSTLLIKSPEIIQSIKKVAAPNKYENFDQYLDEYVDEHYAEYEMRIKIWSFPPVKTEEDIRNRMKDWLRDTVFSDYSTNVVNFDEFFSAYIKENGIEKLAEIFHRYKPLWLAFKHHSKFMKTTINKMRKLADKYHKPLTPKLLDTITSAKKINIDELKSELEKVTVFKKISLANAILFRTSSPENIAYFIRNGKVFAEEYDKKFKFDYKILTAIMDSIVKTVRPNVEGKKIYLPENLTYAAPISEKKFVGEIPFNSSYTFAEKSVVVGVHWFNLDNERVDLDLHLNSNKRDIGWQNDFGARNFIDTKNEAVIFSGDMTDAPKESGGATEAYFVGESVTDETMMINLNCYTQNIIGVPFKLILGEVNQAEIDRNYLINSHEISFCLPNKIEGGEMFLGFLHGDDDGNKKFYFTSAFTGKRIVAHSDEKSLRMTSAIITSLESCLKLKDILKDAGAIFEKADDEDWDINLDPQVVTKDTFLNLFAKE